MKERCWKCHGWGTLTTRSKCPHCRGVGTIKVEITKGRFMRQRCEKCKGEGSFKDRCNLCEGTGFYKMKEEKAVRYGKRRHHW